MDDRRQKALLIDPGQRARVWCKAPGCPHELTDPESKRRGYGPTCDPEPRHTSPRFDIDQDAIPGL
ncbi:DUF6011 domain-containing protein [Streptomyces prasinopilosus]|uniref:DUF6011 domain-containing protein n=1 Tax=Streptomyces prasinopilosus TaxID=67344 RepID=UPI000AA36A38|nr:DUF6011 domain-containing protein [Streptomyces prasinopilosus]